MHSIDAMKGKVRDVDYSDHLMWKLEPPLRSVTNPLIQYEFLIEYKISDPVTGIYFGCKAIADYDVTIEQLIEISDREWADVKKGVIKALNAKFNCQDFDKKLKQTDNANYHTYWPFWIPLENKEDIRGVGKNALTIIRNIYKDYFNNPEKYHSKDKKTPKPLT